MRRQPSTCALAFPTAARGCAHLRRTHKARAHTHTHTQAGSLARALAYASPPARPRARYGRARTPVPTLRPVGPSPRPSAASSPPSCPWSGRDHGLRTLVTARTAAPELTRSGSDALAGARSRAGGRSGRHDVRVAAGSAPGGAVCHEPTRNRAGAAWPAGAVCRFLPPAGEQRAGRVLLAGRRPDGGRRRGAGARASQHTAGRKRPAVQGERRRRRGRRTGPIHGARVPGESSNRPASNILTILVPCTAPAPVCLTYTTAVCSRWSSASQSWLGGRPTKLCR